MRVLRRPLCLLRHASLQQVLELIRQVPKFQYNLLFNGAVYCLLDQIADHGNPVLNVVCKTNESAPNKTIAMQRRMIRNLSIPISQNFDEKSSKNLPVKIYVQSLVNFQARFGDFFNIFELKILIRNFHILRVPGIIFSFKNKITCHFDIFYVKICQIVNF